jgi:hypothetical protein
MDLARNGNQEMEMIILADYSKKKRILMKKRA